jgi:hypothetical protein
MAWYLVIHRDKFTFMFTLFMCYFVPVLKPHSIYAYNFNFVGNSDICLFVNIYELVTR